MERMRAEPLMRQSAVNRMTEAEAIAGNLGIRFRLPLDRCIADAEKAGRHKTFAAARVAVAA